MIARMSKYNFVLFAAQSEDFIARLRELGLVDITTTGWEPTEGDRQLMIDIEAMAKASNFLAQWRTVGEHALMAEQSAKYNSGREAFEAYEEAARQAAAHHAEIESFSSYLIGLTVGTIHLFLIFVPCFA